MRILDVRQAQVEALAEALLKRETILSDELFAARLRGSWCRRTRMMSRRPCCWSGSALSGQRVGKLRNGATGGAERVRMNISRS